MIQTIRKAWAIPELRKKIIFTALILLIFRIGNAIPVPYVDTGLLKDYIDQLSTTVLGLYNVMSGGAFAEATVFALGVQPYINSSIIIQLLTIAIPALERMARDGGEEGKKKIQSITRYATVAIAILQGWAYYMLMKNYNILGDHTGVWPALVIIASFIAGSSFVMWMGEQITEFGIGNGISIILFAGILSRVPSMVSSMISGIQAGTLAWWAAVLVVVGMLALIVLMMADMVSGGILGKFEDTLTAIPILITFIPMLTDTGGNAGAQSSTLVIRSLALHEISVKDALKVIWKELRVALICGLILGALNYIRILIQYPGHELIGLTVAIAMLCTVVMAKVIGGVLPLIATKLHLDPAMMASPLITTIVDSCSLLIFLSISRALLHIPG